MLTQSFLHQQSCEEDDVSYLILSHTQLSSVLCGNVNNYLFSGCLTASYIHLSTNAVSTDA